MINVNVIYIFILAIRIYNINPFVGICTQAVNTPTLALSLIRRCQVYYLRSDMSVPTGITADDRG